MNWIYSTHPEVTKQLSKNTPELIKSTLFVIAFNVAFIKTVALNILGYGSLSESNKNRGNWNFATSNSLICA